MKEDKSIKSSRKESRRFDRGARESRSDALPSDSIAINSSISKLQRLLGSIGVFIIVRLLPRLLSAYETRACRTVSEAILEFNIYFQSTGCRLSTAQQ